ncbi:multidrug effflux MFS transporter [Thalassomonas haliotis]|uniref:Bcr/CflA family efflux transporter n=1 Tax=Thalassomonas haliotis TaxID=485448 RepID=A0ABY7VAA7_9GAMM|nr:multidrug effflux MFS transporter [Thalassomonas haliotis]WDE10577.1 multidrug effflux MFS transporter [Thalassomonas haliotis]
MTPQTTNSNQLVFLLVLLVLFSPLAIDIYLPALPVIAEQFAVDITSVQDTVTWFMVTLGLGQLLAGPLADRFGRRPVALGGVLIYGLCSLLAYCSQSIDMLLATRLLQGFGACATSVAAFASVRDCFGAARSGRMISYLNGAICFIPAMAPVLGSWLTAEFGWRSNFSFMAGFAVLGWGIVMLFYKETRPDNTCVDGRMLSLSRYWSVLAEPKFLYHAILCMLSMAVILAYVTSAPAWLMTGLGLDMSQFTLWFGINAVLNIIACFLAPKMMDKLGTRKTLTLGLLVITSSGLLMLALRPFATPWAYMLPVFCSSIGYACVLGSAAGRALAPFGDRAGTAAALLGLFQMSGAGLMVSLTQRVGLSAPMLLAMQMLLLLPGLMILWSKYGRRWHQGEVSAD